MINVTRAIEACKLAGVDANRLHSLPVCRIHGRPMFNQAHVVALISQLAE